MSALKVVMFALFALVMAVIIAKFAWFVLEESTAKITSALQVKES